MNQSVASKKWEGIKAVPGELISKERNGGDETRSAARGIVRIKVSSRPNHKVGDDKKDRLDRRAPAMIAPLPPHLAASLPSSTGTSEAAKTYHIPP